MKAKDVMTSPVITVTADTAVADVAALLLERRISGAPVVEPDGRLVGIVTEGDLLHRAETGTERRRSRWLELITGRGASASDFVKSHGRRVADVMTRPVHAVGPDTELAEIASLMERERIKRVPVCEDGRIVGIVSRANLLHGLVAYRHGQAEPLPSGDDEIRRHLTEQLAHEHWINANKINIVVAGGVVHLWGEVENDEQRRALRVAAESVPGVRGVEEHLHRHRWVE
ncbi:CBS domain-containing protein [Azospirillum halopraeferens]|uniref:CBS domain-containing protein n=1 Tax=Azospirillum halopraeferens TaxID=34010 RepID=UPI000422FA0D|nr:CBS domain-containing protein [Azospirillum halopraeferens]